MHPIILPVQSDENLKVCGYPEGGGIKICFREGGYLNIGLFRKAYHKAEDGQTFSSGPITVKVAVSDGEVALAVSIALPNGKTAEKTIPAEVCDEIAERVTQVDMLLFTYVCSCPAPRRLPLERAVQEAAEKA